MSLCVIHVGWGVGVVCTCVSCVLCPLCPVCPLAACPVCWSVSDATLDISPYVSATGSKCHGL